MLFFKRKKILRRYFMDLKILFLQNHHNFHFFLHTFTTNHTYERILQVLREITFQKYLQTLRNQSNLFKLKPMR